MSKDDKTSKPSQPADDAAPIVVPAHLQSWTFGDHLRHLAGHRGIEPLPVDEYGRCVICVQRGWFRPNG